jgi:hypothetical protein
MTEIFISRVRYFAAYCRPSPLRKARLSATVRACKIKFSMPEIYLTRAKNRGLRPKHIPAIIAA